MCAALRLCDDEVRIRAVESERTDAGDAAGCGQPRDGFSGDAKRKARFGDMRIQIPEVQMRGDYAMAERQDGTNQARNARGRFQVPDIRLYRPDVRRRRPRVQQTRQSPRLDRVS